MNSAKNFHNTLTAKLKWMTASVYRRSTSFHVQILQQVTSVFTLCFQWFLWEVLVSAAYSSVQQTRTTYKDKCKAWLGRELARLFIAEWFCWRNKYWILPFPQDSFTQSHSTRFPGSFLFPFFRGTGRERILEATVFRTWKSCDVSLWASGYVICSVLSQFLRTVFQNRDKNRFMPNQRLAKIRFVSFVLMTCLL